MSPAARNARALSPSRWGRNSNGSASDQRASAVAIVAHTAPEGSTSGRSQTAPNSSTIERNTARTSSLTPPSESHALDVEAGQTVDLTVRFRRAKASGESFDGAMMFTFGLDADDSDPQVLIDAAATEAAAADLVVLVVGTNSKVESEGFDRTTLALPGRQDDLARAVLAANPRTVVVVNAGSPVLLPWRDDVAAVLATYFGGQEYGDALADVLAGERPDDLHLRSCGACADRLAELAAAEVAVVASLAALPPAPVPEGLVERLTAALRDEGVL